MLEGSVMPLYSETGYKFLQAGTVLSQKNHSCGWLNLGTVIVMVMLNGILCSFSAPLNGCPLNGTVIGVRHKFLLFAEMARYLNVWMSFWRTHTCQNTHTQNTGQLFFRTESLQARPWSKSSARELSTSMSSSWLCQCLPIWQWASLQNGDSNVSLSWRMLEKRA